MNNNEIFFTDLSRLTPSQLYISSDKMQKVNGWFHGTTDQMNPIPVKKLAGRLLMTDGHTRAVAAYLSGIAAVPCIWDTDDMDWAAYAADINLCAEEGITSVALLSKRIVSGDDYKVLWQDRCDAMYDERCYAVLTQTEETIFFTRQKPAVEEWDIRPIDLGFPEGEYYQMYVNHVPVARGCIERYSYEFWEAADIKAFPEHRHKGYGYAITAYLTNRIVACGKTATCRTLPKNDAMNRIIQKCGYQKLYE